MTSYTKAEIESEAAIFAEGTKFSGDDLIQAWHTFRQEDERLQDFLERYLRDNTVDTGRLAGHLGYEEIKWDEENDCYSGFGSSDPMDRSRDDAGGFFVAADDEELEKIAKREVG